MACNEIEAVIKSLPNKIKSELNGLVQNSTKLRKELMPILWELSHNIKTERTLLNYFYKATDALIPNSPN